MTGAPVMSSTDDITGGADLPEAAATPPQPDQEVMENLIRLTDLFTPSAVRAGATHGVFSALAAGVTPERIAADGGLDLPFLRILVDFYAEIGLLRIEGDAITLSPTGLALAQAEPALTLRGMFGQTARSMVGMEHTLATGEIATQGVSGTDFWTALSESDPDDEVIEREMSAGTVDYDSDIVRDLVDWSGVTSVVDLGGGRGDLLLKVLDALPQASGTVLEYGHMATVAARHLATTPLAGRVRAHEGSYLEPLDLRADVFLLSGILADWLDDDALTILRHARDAAAASGGRVVLAEIALRGASARERLYHRMIVSRPVRETDELERLARLAGFSSATVLGQTPQRSVLELIP